MGGAFFVALSVWMTSYRKKKVSSKNVKSLTPFEIEMKARFYLQEKKSFWIQKENLLSKKNECTVSDAYYHVNQIYKEGLKMHPQSTFLQFAYSTFLISNQNLNYALGILSKLDRSPHVELDFRHGIFQRKHLIESILSKRSGCQQVKQYLEYLYFLQKIDSLKISHMEKKMFFLNELGKTNCNVGKIISYGLEIYQISTEIESCHIKAFAINPSPKGLRSYASFVCNSLGQVEFTKNLIESAEKMEKDNICVDYKSKSNGLEALQALFDDSNAVLILSGDERTLGEILQCNIGALEM
jgi:hypothetical protein